MAKRLTVLRKQIERLVKGDIAVTSDTALRLSQLLGNTAEFWMNLQHSYDLNKATKTLGLSRIRPL